MNDTYSKIPSKVRLNANICPNAKLLYGVIYLLSLKEGFCYASNNCLSSNINVSVRTITRLLKELKNENLIRVKYTDKCVRKIYI